MPLYELPAYSEKQRELKAYKDKVDPNNILNPGKSFSRASMESPRLFSIPTFSVSP